MSIRRISPAWKANRLRALRFEKRLSQQEVAHRVNISQGMFWRYERAYAEPDEKLKKRIARALRVPVEELAVSA